MEKKVRRRSREVKAVRVGGSLCRTRKKPQGNLMRVAPVGTEIKTKASSFLLKDIER